MLSHDKQLKVASHPWKICPAGMADYRPPGVERRRGTKYEQPKQEAGMSPTIRATLHAALSTHRFDAVKSKIAKSLVGSAVGVMAGPGAILHGQVSAVQFEGGEPKLLVAGTRYDLDKVLTVIPPEFSQ
jgi:hypothetical protein